jgi:hypothetical protein
MSRGHGVCQQQVIEKLVTIQDERHRGFHHRWRWYTLEMLGLVNSTTPVSVRSSYSRAVRSLEAEGLLQTRNRFPYDAWFLTPPPPDDEFKLYIDPAHLSPWPARPGKPLWFRIQQDEPQDWNDLYELQDALWLFKLFDIEGPDDEMADFAGMVDQRAALRSPPAQWLRWFFYRTRIKDPEGPWWPQIWNR